jgi:hypothetical protein
MTLTWISTLHLFTEVAIFEPGACQMQDYNTLLLRQFCINTVYYHFLMTVRESSLSS